MVYIAVVAKYRAIRPGEAYRSLNRAAGFMPMTHHGQGHSRIPGNSASQKFPAGIPGNFENSMLVILFVKDRGHENSFPPFFQFKIYTVSQKGDTNYTLVHIFAFMCCYTTL